MVWVISMVVLFAIIIISSIVNEKNEQEKIALMTPDEKQKYIEEKPEDRMRRQSAVRSADFAKEKQRLRTAEDNMTPDEKQKYHKEILAEANQRNQEIVAIRNYGQINSAMMCPHCQTKGKIRTKPIKQKKGISGGKATAAVFTGGLSLLAVGLSRKESSTQAHCDSCNNTWLF